MTRIERAHLACVTAYCVAMLVFVVAGVLLAGCVSAPDGARPLTAHEAQVVHAVTGDACDLSTVRVLVAEDRAGMFQATGYCEPGCSTTSESGECRWGCAHGALVHWREGVWPFVLAEDWSPLIVLWHASYSDALMAHEAEHLAAECRGQDPYTH